MKLSLCMIVRDSARTLPACLESIRPWVDEMIIVDTGSQDDTPQIVKRMGGKLFHFPWCDDFAAARNESLRHATGEWMFWMDSDDTIDAENGRRLRELADGRHDPNVYGYIMQVHCPGEGGYGVLDATAVDHVKMLRNGVDIEFECRIHEQVLISIRRLGGEIAWTDIYVVHSGADQSPQGRRRKQQRDMRLLKLELEDRPNHPFALFNVGMTYADMEQYGDAAEYLNRSLEVSDVQESHVVKAYGLLVHCLSQQDKTEHALARCDEGLRYYPLDAELQFRRGVLAHRLGRVEEAVKAFRTTLSGQAPRKMSSVDRGITSFKARHNLALVFRDMGRLDLAELQWREALRTAPGFRPAWRGLGEVLIQQQRLAAAQVLAEQLDQVSNLQAESRLLRASIQQAEGDEVGTRATLESTFRDFTDDAAVCDAYAQFLFERAEWKVASGVLERLVTLQPENGAAYHNLGAARLNVGDAVGAVAALQRSLEARPTSTATEALLLQAQSMLPATTA